MSVISRIKCLNNTEQEAISSHHHDLGLYLNTYIYLQNTVLVSMFCIGKHKAVFFFQNMIEELVELLDRNARFLSRENSSYIGKRKKRQVPDGCNVVEVAVIADETVWNLLVYL